MSGMDDLVTWLRAALDDDERVARAAAEQAADVWRSYFKQVHAPGSRFGENPAEANTSEVAEHIARHDPFRVLAEVDAKRRILDDIVSLIDSMDAQIDAEFGGGYNPVRESDALVKLMALPYAYRLGYREEWKP